MGSYYIELVVTKEPVEGCIVEAAAKLKSVDGGKIPECEITFEWYRNDMKLSFSPSPQYIANAEDVDYPLDVKCFARDKSTGELLGESAESTGHVRKFPKEFPVRAVIPLEPAEKPLSILSYNILSQLYIFEKYPSCPDWALNCWYRRQLVLREIKILLPDIICLQEVDEICNDFLALHLGEMHYQIYYKMKDGIREGCLTAFRGDNLEYVDRTDINFSELAREKFQNPSTRASYEKPNVALILKLRWKKDGTHIFVSNCHLCASSDLARFFQGVTLLKTLEQLTDATSAILLCGDFNTTRDSQLYMLITAKNCKPVGDDGQKFSKDMKRKTFEHKLPTLNSTYKSFLDAHPADSKAIVEKHTRLTEPFTLFTKDQCFTSDYIFFSVNTLRCVGILELPDKDKVIHGRLPLLPSALWPSDHISLMGLFQPLQVVQQSPANIIPKTDGTRTNASVVSMCPPSTSPPQNMNQAGFFQQGRPHTRFLANVRPRFPLYAPFLQQGTPYTRYMPPHSLLSPLSENQAGFFQQGRPHTRFLANVRPRFPLYPAFLQQGTPYTRYMPPHSPLSPLSESHPQRYAYYPTPYPQHNCPPRFHEYSEYFQYRASPFRLPYRMNLRAPPNAGQPQNPEDEAGGPGCYMSMCTRAGHTYCLAGRNLIMGNQRSTFPWWKCLREICTS